MTDSTPDPAESQISAEFFSTPLREMAEEVHEIYVELERAGIPERALVQIIAHMVSDAILYRVEFDDEDDDDEDENESTEPDDEPA